MKQDKRIKIKHFIFCKMLPLICVISLIVSSFIVSASAEVILPTEEDQSVVCFTTLTDLFVFDTRKSSDLKFAIDNNPYFQQPHFESTKIVNYGYNYFNAYFTFNQEKFDFNKYFLMAESVVFRIPFVFYQITNTYYAPLENSFTITVYSTDGTAYSSDFTLEYIKDGNTTYYYYNDVFVLSGTILSKIDYLKLSFTVAGDAGTDQAVYGGWYSSDYTELFNHAKMDFTLKSGVSFYDEYYSIFNDSDMGVYFDLEKQINNKIDTKSFITLISDMSIFDNFGNGLAAVREIFNEFINYDGTRWTWLYNLLMISLYIGIVPFVLGTSVYILGGIANSQNRANYHSKQKSGKGRKP